MRRCAGWFTVVLGLLCLAAGSAAAADPPPTGFQAEVEVENPTRLDWEFVASAFGPDAAKLKDYDSRKQRYQLFVPKNYDKTKAWPLVVFISPGDDPGGWKFWQKPCEDGGMLFCAAYRAGNNCPVGERTRIVLDALDDVRRHYNVDPDQTYLTGFSGGGRMACTIGFALPECFGGVVPICGTNPLPRLTYLQHRLVDRLSVAFVTGTGDMNRSENEDWMYPLFQDVGVRSKLWVVPKLGHGIPAPDVLAEVRDWLAEDLKRRQADAKARPGLALAPDEAPGAEKQAKGLLEAAQADLKDPARTWRGTALLQGAVARWGKTDSGEKARKLRDEFLDDPKKAALVQEQGGKEEIIILTAQGRGFEKMGALQQALKAYRLLAKQHPDAAEGKKAAEEAKRLAATPYLGLAFDGAKVTQVAPKGPADAVGIKKDDVLVKLGNTKVASVADVRKELQGHKAGDKVTAELQRGGTAVTVTVELGSLPEGDE
jgi:predicted esterase